MLRLGGLASGIDTDSMIKQLMTAHRIPVDRLIQQRQSVEWQRDAYREMNTKLANFRNNSISSFRLQGTFTGFQTEVSGDTAAISAKASANATPGSTTIQVDSLATAASKWSGEDIRSDIQNFDATATLASQQDHLKGDTVTTTLNSFEINGTTVEIDTNVDSLDDVINRINKTTNVSAFLDTETGKISFKSKETGLVNGAGGNEAHITFGDPDNFLQDVFKVDVTGNVTTDGDPLKDSTMATVANVTINGLETTRNSNTFSINGVEVTLLQATGNEATIKTTRDTGKILDAVKNFVTTYNEMLADLNIKVGEAKYRDFQPLTDDQKSQLSDKEVEQWEEKAMSGLLKNDPILNKTINNLRSVAIAQVEVADGQFLSLNDLGISTGSYTERGVLHLDEAKLTAAIDADPDAVVAFFTKSDSALPANEQGIGTKMYADLKVSLDELSKKAGSPSSLVNNSFIDKDIGRINDRIDVANRRLTDLETRYFNQFAAMESAMHRLNSQADYLANALGGLQ